MEKFTPAELTWLNTAEQYVISDNEIIIQTSPDTDYWRGTYYGLEYNNAPAAVICREAPFWTLKAKVSFTAKAWFDQCGLFIYQDADHWMKSGIEYQRKGCQQLFSVVTNAGFSDWSMADLAQQVPAMYYRLSRRGSDFLLENSADGVQFNMMRMFHLFHAQGSVQFGFFASSPGDSSFAARFSDIALLDCQWPAHNADRF